jgi:hypothetical protein
LAVKNRRFRILFYTSHLNSLILHDQAMGGLAGLTILTLKRNSIWKNLLHVVDWIVLPVMQELQP